MSKTENSKSVGESMAKQYKACVRLEHIATSYPEVVPINSKEYMLLTVKDNQDACSDLAFGSMISRGALEPNWFEDYFFEGVYYEGQLKSHQQDERSKTTYVMR